MESLNLMALELVDEALEFTEELAVEAWELDNGATVIDMGVETPGGIEAGLLLAEIQTAGLASVSVRAGEVGGAAIPHVELTCDHPATGLLCSQKAGWEISTGSFEGLGSGPARALVAEEEEFHRIGYRDEADFATLAVECDHLPTADVAEQVSELTRVDTAAVFLPAFRTDSITGSVALAARAAELAVFRLSELGYNPLDVLTAVGSAPVAPVAGDYETAVARTNDAVAYGGRVHLTVENDFDRFAEVPSVAGAEYGVPFADIFDGVEWDFRELPTGLFAPAQVTIDVRGGPTYALGERDEDVLADGFGL
jgi:methenyltetrahydromethanopterin cyclohydrolase